MSESKITILTTSYRLLGSGFKLSMNGRQDQKNQCLNFVALKDLYKRDSSSQRNIAIAYKS